MHINCLKVMTAVTAVMLFGGISARASEPADVRHVAGEITWVDLKVGAMDLKKDADPYTGEITAYRITRQETRVKSPLDKKFLSVDDLRPGQHVIVDVINGQEEKIVEKITADPRPASDLQEAYGQIEAVNVPAGTITVSGGVFESNSIVIMQSPSRDPIQLELKPGDVVKVEFIVKDGKQMARFITLYVPRVTRTTTTTTVITTP